MNKYQEAVEYLTSLGYNRNNDYPEGSVGWEVVNSCNNVYNSLKELVDRATPKKVKMIIGTTFLSTHARCDSCNYEFAIWNENFCPNCGQAIDWSDE